MTYKNTFSAMPFIKKGQLNKNGEAPVKIRVTVKGSFKEISANLHVKPDHWEKGKGRIKNGVKDAPGKNQYIDNLIYKIGQCKRDLTEEGVLVTAQTILDRYKGIDQENKTVLEIFDEHNQKCEELSGKDFSPATIQKYKSCRLIVANYIKTNYNKNDLPISSVDHKFVKELEHYIKTKRNCSNNTTIKYLQNFRKIVLIALNYGWIKKDPFQNIKFRKEKTYPTHLDEAELKRIRNKDISIDRIERVRDIFVFCCFTGLAYSDIKNLNHEDITTLQSNQQCIKKRRQKTGVMSFIPLLEAPKKILEKYKNDPICIESGKLLPVLSNQKMNAYLKEIADLCEITKNIGMHTARHTFATTVTLSNNIPIEVVSEMLGHSSLQQTKHYSRVMNNYVLKEMQKIENSFSTSERGHLKIV